MDIHTARLILHAIDEAEGRRIYRGEPGPSDSWADDYPFPGDRAAILAYLNAAESRGEQRPFGYYRIARRSDLAAIGGIGFKGPPDAGGVVEVGYGLAPSARGHGYAAEALGAILDVATRHAIGTIRADTNSDNIASQRTLEHAGFSRVGPPGELFLYEVQPG